MTEGLHVGLVVSSTFCEWRDVVANGGEGRSALRFAEHTERLSVKEMSPESLQASTSNALGLVGLIPGISLMGCAASVGYLDGTARVGAVAQRGGWHSVNPEDEVCRDDAVINGQERDDGESFRTHFAFDFLRPLAVSLRVPFFR